MHAAADMTLATGKPPCTFRLMWSTGLRIDIVDAVRCKLALHPDALAEDDRCQNFTVVPLHLAFSSLTASGDVLAMVSLQLF